ncbi:MAG TPA: flagellar basal-body MS-ring/collar protein FliF [Nevskiaceae bacterium]|nr:flagellar basal-body MS-ring/collar protein FliF [Nevskiaceae bacterium]
MPDPATASAASRPTGAASNWRETLRGWRDYLAQHPLIPMAVGSALVVAIVAAAFLWASGPDYSVLFTNLGYSDGGKITGVLKQEHVPYKLAQGGHAILVPANDVYNLRLQLASKGLPSAGDVGLSLMDNQPFGVSQFAEQVNFQRGLQGELERSIDALRPVAKSRVNLALPSTSPFVETRKPAKATVVLTLHSGMAMSRGQVDAIVHLVASAVRDLAPQNVTVVDQDGTLLAPLSRGAGADSTRLAYVQTLEASYRRRIDAAIAPIVGLGNARTEVTASVDFNQQDQTSEHYGPNQGKNPAAVLSQQVRESFKTTNPPKGGIPGALTNTPPGAAASPINAPRAANARGANGKGKAQSNAKPGAFDRQSTTNYQVDKTITHTQAATGVLKSLSVSVVVNDATRAGPHGKHVATPLGQTEMSAITRTVKAAMGYSAARGDQLSVVNAAFAPPAPTAPQSLMQRFDVGAWLPQALRYLALLVLILLLYRLVLRPLVKRYTEFARAVRVEPVTAGAAPPAADASPEAAPQPKPRPHSYEQTLDTMKTMARDDPSMLATIIHSWVNRHG